MFKLSDYNEKESHRAFRTLKKTLQEDLRPVTQSVGWPGKSEHLNIYWRPDFGFWTFLWRNPDGSGYWCAYGIDKPRATQIHITAEVNPPSVGVNGNLAGAFVQGPDGHVYLAHSGKIGGGKKGVGKTAFVNFCRGVNWQPVEKPDGKQSSMIVLGRIDSPKLLPGIAHFTHEVARFKAAVRSGEKLANVPDNNFGFSPEFQGKRTSYPLGGEIEAECLHGWIVNSLAEILREKQIDFANDQPRDLFIKHNGNVSILFEVKTNTSTTSIYGGVGQLMLHAAREQETPRRILVLPGDLEKDVADAVGKLGIEILQYTWKKNRAEFPNINNVIGAPGSL